MRIGFVLIVVILSVLVLTPATLIHAQSTPTPTPELSMMVTVVPPGSDIEAAQDAVMVYEVSAGDMLIAALIFALIVLLLLNGVWELRRAKPASLILLLVALLLLRADPGAIRAQPGQWCGYALIEGLPDLAEQLPMLSLLAPDESPSRRPHELFQVKVSLDGTKAIIEACWKVFPSRGVILNLLSLGGRDRSQSETRMTYSIFAPDGSREDSAASVRHYLSEHQKDWETQEE